jgi:lipopolysaccharide transport system permease protein
MSRVVYTSQPRVPLARLISPYRIVKDLLRHRELIAAYTRREFESAHRGTYLGLAWSVISPLIMLALFTFVFGYVFNGRFTQRVDETPAEFALALFIGLSLFQCVAQSMGAASSLVTANATYVKTLSFPLEILSVSSTLNVLTNLAISLGLAFLAYLAVYGAPHWSMLWLAVHVACIALISLGLSWFISAVAVFIRDVSAIIPPITLVLMFASSVFFPLSAVPQRVRWVLELNPLAVIIDQARACFLQGVQPNVGALIAVVVFSVVVAIAGYWFFMRAKPAFADVL